MRMIGVSGGTGHGSGRKQADHPGLAGAFETAPTPMEVRVPARTATPVKPSNGHANAAKSSSQLAFGSRAAGESAFVRVSPPGQN